MNWDRLPTTESTRIRTLRYAAFHGPLAQLVEQGTLNPKVEGSIPSRPISPVRCAIIALMERPPIRYARIR
jgi:hypothetical protein